MTDDQVEVERLQYHEVAVGSRVDQAECASTHRTPSTLDAPLEGHERFDRFPVEGGARKPRARHLKACCVPRVPLIWREHIAFVDLDLATTTHDPQHPIQLKL